jgi:hypothetical protein
MSTRVPDELPVALAFSQYQRKISIAMWPILASRARAMQNGILQPQFGRKPGKEGAYSALCIWIHSGILGATPQAGKHPGSGVPKYRKFEPTA